MRRFLLYLCTILGVFAWRPAYSNEASDISLFHIKEPATVQSITAMEALDRVKEQQAANFEKVYRQDSQDEYYYKLPFAEYYLVYEGMGETENDYLFHLYEFVMDDTETGVGHTVTYGWYSVNKTNGKITDQTR